MCCTHWGALALSTPGCVRQSIGAYAGDLSLLPANSENQIPYYRSNFSPIWDTLTRLSFPWISIVVPSCLSWKFLSLLEDNWIKRSVSAWSFMYTPLSKSIPDPLLIGHCIETAIGGHVTQPPCGKTEVQRGIQPRRPSCIVFRLSVMLLALDILVSFWRISLTRRHEQCSCVWLREC